MHKRKVVLRLIVSPFVFGILFVTYTHGLLKAFVKFIRWGGEWKTYEKEDPARMLEIYNFLKQNTPTNDK